IAFLLGLPANEIVLPILIMGYLSAGTMLELDSLNALRTLLLDHGWTWITALCVMLFSLLHFPCGTTLYTIFQETRSVRWTLIAALLPLALGILVTLLVNQGAQLILR
ncbi:MAG: nucleoside recognition domain-containing protein, partial [Syntrophomonadaceae bacterium]|nr:nucleoside recognition domain-containing protein [Syntrophomonadaceae bacterium]